MRRLIFFVLGFVLTFALLINMGCVTVQSSIIDGMMNELETPNQSYQVPEGIHRGWSPTGNSGNHWILRDFIGGELTVLAKCDYTYMSIRGVEKWKGTYFGMMDSRRWHEPVYDDKLERLSGCVDWVKMFYYGDYMI
jgi:hypothetical protein